MPAAPAARWSRAARPRRAPAAAGASRAAAHTVGPALAGTDPQVVRDAAELTESPDSRERVARRVAVLETGHRLRHLLALAAFALAALLTMRPWLDPRLLPGNDFPGFAAEVEWTRRTLDREGALAAWTPDRFGGSTRFMSNLKEIATYPLAARYGAVQGTKLMFLLMRIAGAFGVYLICARYLRSPPAGLVAGYAYGFGAPANLQSGLGGHLDLVVSSALFPMILLAATAMLQRCRSRDAVVVGALVAVEFCVHSYLHAMAVPAMILLLLWLRPWRRDRDEEQLFASRWVGLGATALAVVLLLGASQAAWLAADLPNHGLHTPEALAQGLQTYVEHSPFLYVNRNDWLQDWLARHSPPAMLLSGPDHLFNQRRYLGVVALALCVVGWFVARSDFTLRRWFQLFLLLFTFQYWMSLGPYTLVWQLGRTFHWPESVDGPLRAGLSLGAAACIGWAALLLRRRGAARGASCARVELAFGLGLSQIVAAHSLFGLLHAWVPIFRGMRSPGHFFDLASFPFFAMVGVAVAAGVRRTPRPTRAILVLAIVAALVVDYWPTLAAFERRRDGAVLETMRRAAMTLPGEDGTLRIAVSPASNPPAANLVTASANAGSAWGWLSWQAGRYWRPFLSVAMARFSPDVDEPRMRQVAGRTSDALLRSGRLRWVLEEFAREEFALVPRLRVEPPWKPVAEAEPFALWEGPEVLPMGTVFGGFVLFVGGTAWEQAPAIGAAFTRGLVSVAGGKRLSDSSESLVGAAAIVHAMGAEPFGDPASHQLAARHAATLVDPRAGSSREQWAAFLAASSVRAPSAATYSRPAPDRMVLEADAGPAPAMLFVSEAYHPWWRARIDGATAEVLRAQIAFMAVRIPPGSHRVELELEPPLPLRVADRVSQLSWIALAGAVLVAGARGLRRPAARRS